MTLRRLELPQNVGGYAQVPESKLAGLHNGENWQPKPGSLPEPVDRRNEIGAVRRSHFPANGPPCTFRELRRGSTEHYPHARFRAASHLFSNSPGSLLDRIEPETCPHRCKEVAPEERLLLRTANATTITAIKPAVTPQISAVISSSAFVYIAFDKLSCSSCRHPHISAGRTPPPLHGAVLIHSATGLSPHTAQGP
jgi:hypothetical protein